MTQAVEWNVFQVGIFENLLMKLRYGVGVVHLSGGWRRKRVLVIGMLIMFLDQEVYGFLRDGYSADGGFGLRAGEGQLSIGITDILFTDEDCAVLYIKVIPEESDQLTFAETADQFQVEHREESFGVGGIQVGFHILWVKCLSFKLLNLGSDAVIGGITGD